ncbi:hypothetical protein L873DRAFT_189593 [Choiromyces venosus 120613-1]|uniref:Uncharacterized protein n=1 Tax=Choiromyces venosus 120613-1 TaxID=1336337 RepID=A0A3N4J2U1_9PEZI|nr:hypothetical protein L873DRAFT_189593 [Choiromyces venosus 120613-1]
MHSSTHNSLMFVDTTTIVYHQNLETPAHFLRVCNSSHKRQRITSTAVTGKGVWDGLGNIRYIYIYIQLARDHLSIILHFPPPLTSLPTHRSTNMSTTSERLDRMSISPPESRPYDDAISISSGGRLSPPDRDQVQLALSRELTLRDLERMFLNFQSNVIPGEATHDRDPARRQAWFNNIPRSLFR